MEGSLGAGDRGATVLAALGPVSLGSTELPLGTAGAKLVQDWVRGEQPNHGFLIQDYANTDGLDLADRESSTPEQRPGLVVTFDPGPVARIAPSTLEVGSGETFVLDGLGSTPSVGATLTGFEWSQPRDLPVRRWSRVLRRS